MNSFRSGAVPTNAFPPNLFAHHPSGSPTHSMDVVTSQKGRGVVKNGSKGLRQSTNAEQTYGKKKYGGGGDIGNQEPKEVLVMTIEIEEGKTDTIRVMENDNPHDLAYSFCLRHGLGIQVVEALQKNIEMNIDKVLSEQGQQISHNNRSKGASPQQGGGLRDSRAHELRNGFPSQPSPKHHEGGYNPGPKPMTSYGNRPHQQPQFFEPEEFNPPREQHQFGTQNFRDEGRSLQHSHSQSNRELNVFERLQLDVTRKMMQKNLQDDGRRSPKARRGSPSPRQYNQRRSPEPQSRKEGKRSLDGHGYGHEIYSEVQTSSRDRRRQSPGPNLFQASSVNSKAAKQSPVHLQDTLIGPGTSIQLAPQTMKFDQIYEDWRSQGEKKKAEMGAAAMEISGSINHQDIFTNNINATNSVNQNDQSKLTNQSKRAAEFPNFMERLTRGMEENNMKQKRMKEEQEFMHNYDPVTGQRLFQPMICRGPKKNSEMRLPVGDHLYNKSKEYDRKKRELFEREQRSMYDQRARSNDRSTAIIEGLRKKNLLTLFNLLDSDGDGVISANRIDISRINTALLELLAPLLCELEELGDTLNQEEFLASADRLMKSLSIAEKDFLLLNHHRRSPNHNNDCTFRPKIDQKSAKIATMLKQKEPKTIYQKCLQERAQFSEKMKNMQQSKEAADMKECRFKPFLIPPAFNSLKSREDGLEVVNEDEFPNHHGGQLSNKHRFDSTDYINNKENVEAL